MLSFYAEVAEVIERFFYDVGILRPQVADYVLNGDPTAAASQAPGLGATVSLEAASPFLEQDLSFPARVAPAPTNARPQPEHNAHFKFCPECNQRTLKLENGCDSCLSCGYSKCDK